MRSTLILSLALAAGALFATAAEASALKLVYSFCDARRCRDGVAPMELSRDATGNLFLVVGDFKRRLGGLIVELAHGKTPRTLYRFPCDDGICPNGAGPVGPLVVDVRGNLYGVTYAGGAHNQGTVFKLTPGAKDWTLATLYDFCAQGGDACTDGKQPVGLTYAGAASGQPYDGTSPLYGTASGGANGVAFMLQPADGPWTETVLYSFCALAQCADGAGPWMPPIMDGAGNLFGVAVIGGGGDNGAIYELSPSGGGAWVEKVVHNFCQEALCTDGDYPNTAVAFDADGNLWGTTLEGGTHCKAATWQSCGVIYKLGPDGSSYTVLHSFCQQSDCKDGTFPNGIVPSPDGGVYGTTFDGGGNPDGQGSGHSGGTVYRLDGSGFKILHRFCAETDCTDGAAPFAAPILDGDGTLYGTVFDGGANNGGAVFKVARPD
ncbi:MAG TPA: choice-of-anchor tandem repeat GloVer-containing protein [Rhizomicrobium sp.]|nr:choice-of-anchor tandem repeat GloVer-containing protein [Rhizomicrobium sp.]